MAEEKTIRMNIQRELVKVPRWKRRMKVTAIIRKKLKSPDLKIDPKLNEKIFADTKHEFRIKLVKDDKKTTAKLVE
ncbi:MAG: hypothetical protein HYW22_01200 [Candidatus Aenigmarchaeota archaeon]|nr:hypothetical protein [Candidatus Aenigmarchaeota archaeon]